MKIKIRRGLKENLPVLDAGEFGYCTDTKELFIGQSDGLNAFVSLVDSGDAREFTFDIRLRENSSNYITVIGPMKTEAEVLSFYNNNAEDIIFALFDRYSWTRIYISF
jgi:hypothetical protein